LGLLRAAEGETVFVEEISDLSLETQVNLLRAVYFVFQRCAIASRTSHF
jgi:DNA-binding NtrC family response regulator